MLSFWIYGMATAAGLIAPAEQSWAGRRAGYLCVLWPRGAEGPAERKAKGFDVSWVFPDDKMTGHDASAIEVLEAPKEVGARPRVLDFDSDETGINLVLEGGSGRVILTMVVHPDQRGEYDAGLSHFGDSRVGYLGGCHAISADKKMVAWLRRGRRN